MHVQGENRKAKGDKEYCLPLILARAVVLSVEVEVVGVAKTRFANRLMNLNSVSFFAFTAQPTTDINRVNENICFEVIQADHLRDRSQNIKLMYPLSIVNRI